jgi:hypothetical protein
MVAMTLEQVRATDVADLASSLLGLPQAVLLASDAESAEAVVAGAQRVISAMSAVMAVAIEAWGRREGEALSVDKAAWEAMADAEGRTSPGGLSRACLRLGSGVPKDEHDFMPSYLAPVLRLSPRSAGRRYEMARTLVGSLPVTLAAMRAGDLEPHRAQAIVDEVPAANLGVCAAVERALFPRIVDKASTRVGALARRAVAGADLEAEARRAEVAVLGRFVFAGPSGLPGLMRFEAEVDSGKGKVVWAAIQELAAGYLKEDVAATMDQARADAFVDLLLAKAAVSTVVDLALPAGFASTGFAAAGFAFPGSVGAGVCGACGRGPDSAADGSAAAMIGAHGGGSVVEEAAIGVLVDADQEQADDIDQDATAGGSYGRGAGSANRAGSGNGAGPGSGRSRQGPDSAPGAVIRVLAGFPAVGVLDQRAGTLPSAMIQTILADPDTVFRRLVIDPDTGWVTGAGATTYHPGRHLARIVRKRDLHCRFPGCATAARFCDLDHVVPFPVGSTVLANLACLCRRHHRLKTHGHWSLTMSPLGVCTWADRRTGLVHATEPVDYRELAV